MDKDYRLEVRVKNNLLYNRIYSKYPSISKFCEQNHVEFSTVSGLLNFKAEIFSKKGFVRKGVQAVADALKCKLEDIIPANYIVKESNKYVKEISHDELLMIEEVNEPEMLTYEPNYDKGELVDALNEVLDTLPERVKNVLILRFKYGKTYRDVAKAMNVSTERIRQLEKKGLLMCRNPSRRKKLDSFRYN